LAVKSSSAHWGQYFDFQEGGFLTCTVNFAAKMSSTNTADNGNQIRCHRMLPSVGTWFMKPSFAHSGAIFAEVPNVVVEKAVVERVMDAQEEEEKALYMASELSIRQTALDFFWDQVDAEEDEDKFSYMVSEVCLRQAAFDLFWAQVDEEEEDDKFSYIVSELSMRQAAFDFFWAQLDEEEEDEKVSYMISELSLRQAAFDLFWAQLDQEEEDDKCSYMASELFLRWAAFDFFWAQLDQEEEDGKFSYMVSELSLRQAAFDFFWAQLDQEEEDEKVSYMISELSLRQAALDFFWAQLDQEEDDDKFSYMVSELSLRQAAFNSFWAEFDEEAEIAKVSPKEMGQSPCSTIGGSVHLPKAWTSFSMAGSPAKSIRLARISMSTRTEAPLYFLSADLSPEAQKSHRAKKRSSSTSAMVLDLGEPCVHLASLRAKSSSQNKVQDLKGIDKKFVLPPLKSSSSSSGLRGFAENTKVRSLARGC